MVTAMDCESWFKGYETGVMLHNHLRSGTPLSSVLIASASATGVVSDLEWLADLSGVLTLTLLTADYSGDVTVSRSYDGDDFTEPVPLSELLAVNPSTLFSGVDPSEPILYFRFHFANADADLNSFRIYGVKGAN